MRYLILSDIHANLTALEAVLVAAEDHWNQVVCLGDVVGYGPDPNEVIERLRSLRALTIRGNHDKAVAGLLDEDDFNPMASAAVLVARTLLYPDNLEYLRSLPKGPARVGEFTIVHGALHDEDDYVFSPELAADGLVNSPTPVTFFGHTHIQGGFRLRGEEVSVLECKPPEHKSSRVESLELDCKYLLNPGSVGQPRDGDPRAAFAIADLSQQSVAFGRVSYDIQAVQERMFEAGLPEPLILRLSFGR